MHEEFKRMAQEEALRDLCHERKIDDHVSNFLRCCLRFLSDPNVV
jgi:hypothetical protein